MLFKPSAKRLAKNFLNCPTRLRASELGLGLPFKLRLANFYRNTHRKALADVVPCEIVVILTKIAIFASIIVQYPSKRRSKTGNMHAALRSINVVGKSELAR